MITWYINVSIDEKETMFHQYLLGVRIRNTPHTQRTNRMNHTINATEQICNLPAVPTHDWATQAANALALIAPSATAGVLIAHLDPSTGALRPISTGVSGTHAGSRTLPIFTLNTQSESLHHAYAIQDKLERITSLGFDIPDQAFQRGLVSPISLLHSRWQATQIGEIFAATSDQSPVLTIIPITHEHTGFVLIAAIAMDAQQSPSTRPQSIDQLAQTLGQLLPLLSRKAKAALEHVTNPKAWLTDREHQILDQLIIGHSVRVIADNLDRSSHTVHDHVKNLHKKLSASSRGELIAKALGHSMTPPEQQTPAHDPIILTGSSSLAELKPAQAKSIQAKPLAQQAKTY